MNIIICDDEEYSIKKIYEYIKKYELNQQEGFSIKAFRNAETMYEYMTEHTDIDLLFLDVIFKDTNGIKIAKKIREINCNIKIIFMSSAIEFATEGYEVNAEGYLLKPFSFEVFVEKMDYILEKIRKDIERCILDNTDKGKVLLDINDIIYIETSDRNIKIHTKDNIYISYKKMKEYEKLLGKGFYRCHSAYIINLKFVQRIQGLDVILKNGTILTISKMRKKDFMKMFSKYVSSIIYN